MPKLVQLAAGVGTASMYVPTGSIITAVLDIGDTPESDVTYSLSATTPAGTTVSVVASRSSDDGSTAWSSWTAPDGTTLTSPLRRYWQLKLSLATTAPFQATPILVSVTISADGYAEANWKWGYGGSWQ